MRPDIVLVHGDTTTTFATALACCWVLKLGMLSRASNSNFHAPFQEEYNRQSTGLIVDYHFAPTILNKNNLLAEGKSESIIVTGNTIIDALHLVLSNIEKIK